MNIQQELEKYHLTEEQYEQLLIDCSFKANRESDLDWGEIAVKYKLPLAADTLRKASTTILGGAFVKQFLENKYQDIPNDYETKLQVLIQKNKELKRQADKQLKKVQTEKIEYNRWLREDAREELILEKVCEAIATLSPLDVPEYIPPKHSFRSYVLAFGDEHYGTEFEIKGLYGEILNAYSPEIFERRMWDLFNQTVEIIHKENISILHVFSMGDFTDGCLRVKQLMTLRYGVVEGTIKYADFIANWLNELTRYVKVEYQMVTGNHSELRQLGQPKGTFTEDNMTKIVAEFIKVRLKDNPNFVFIENPTGLIYAQICKYTILGLHGEVKDMEKALKDFSQIYNVPVDYLIAGHLHHAKVKDIGIDSEVINVPSIIGADPYSLSLHKMSNAAGKLLIFEPDKGLVCDYRLKLIRN